MGTGAGECETAGELKAPRRFLLEGPLGPEPITYIKPPPPLGLAVLPVDLAPLEPDEPRAALLTVPDPPPPRGLAVLPEDPLELRPGEDAALPRLDPPLRLPAVLPV